MPKYNVTIVFDNGEREELLGVDDLDYKKESLNIYIREGRKVHVNWDKIRYFVVEDLRTTKERFIDDKGKDEEVNK